MFEFWKFFFLCFYVFLKHQVHYKAIVVNNAYLTMMNSTKDNVLFTFYLKCEKKN